MMSRAGGRHREEEEDDGDVGDSCIILNSDSYKNHRGASEQTDTKDDLQSGKEFNPATMAVNLNFSSTEDGEVFVSTVTYMSQQNNPKTQGTSTIPPLVTMDNNYY